MGNIFNPDFRDFLQALNNNKVMYILVGGYSVILHGYSRTTGDMDIWVKKDEMNYQKIANAFKEFKMPVFDMTKENFLNNSEFDVFTFGVPPVAIDIMTSVKGLDFDEAYSHSQMMDVEEIKIRIINYNDLLKAKKAAGRHKDIDDIQNLSGDNSHLK